LQLVVAQIQMASSSAILLMVLLYLQLTTSGKPIPLVVLVLDTNTRLDKSTSILTPKFALDLTVLIHTHSPLHTAKVIGLPSYGRPDIYAVLLSDGSIIKYSDNIFYLKQLFLPVLLIRPITSANATLFPRL
jgi:hypothetical protein